MRILYFGRPHGTSGHRMAALRRLGHQVTLIDAHNIIPANWVTIRWRWLTGGFGMVEVIRRRAIRAIGDATFDLAWIDHGELVSAGLVRDLKARIPFVLCYNIDDPFGGRDVMLWREFFKALPLYDLLVVVRPANVGEAKQRGAKRVMRVYMSADEVAHAPRQLTELQYREWRSEVLFVGTAFPERGPFLARLVELGVPLTIYGNRYRRLREWALLKPHWRAAAASADDRYAMAIIAAKVCLGLLSKGNRDLHTTRSMEIPSLGSLLCAQQTSEHSALYREDEEAVFWSSPEECAEKCFALLADESRRQAIAAAGHQRYLQNPWQNMLVVQAILDEAAQASAATSNQLLSTFVPTDGERAG
ncbi:hypothetical protein ACPOL_4154 [Acidisarcina polymorpha]|uniref:Spore protein YkvP/CgeB glycosyl transferase-like domain-containing protein n=1 Tax=Acidisarcina polymorpha TaxID=2211140 RepID=A0A2Z5G2S4_9BACT|nr:glycosyltransferase [Acidisarcina polymorpha]AXC13431.1 hypothetical protein ACPOL_4154 [Acidisarcina polymorpha]